MLLLILIFILLQHLRRFPEPPQETFQLRSRLARMFTHEKFEAYQLSIDLTHVVLRILDAFPAGHASLRDQLRRAAFSIPLNIAEGTGKSGRSDRLRFYAIARGSAKECAAICDDIALIDSELKPHIEVAKAKLRSIVSILSTVCFSRPRCS